MAGERMGREAEEGEWETKIGRENGKQRLGGRMGRRDGREEWEAMVREGKMELKMRTGNEERKKREN